MSEKPEARRWTAADVMSSPVVTAREDETVRAVARSMLQHSLGAVVVVSASGAPIGMASDGDLLGYRERDPRREWWVDLLADGAKDLARPRFLDERPVREVMSAPLITISARTPVGEIADLMKLNQVKRLPVVRGSELLGIVSRADIVGVVAKLAPPTHVESSGGLMDFLAGLIGGFSLKGLPVRSPVANVVAATHRTPEFTAKGLRKEAETFESSRWSQMDADRTASRLKRQSEVKAMLQAHVDEALWREILDHAEAAAARGEFELQLLQFPCALCTDGGRMIDVAEPGWETTLRGEPAEIYARWREELQSHGFGISARIAGYDDQGAIGEAGLFLKWGA